MERVISIKNKIEKSDYKKFLIIHSINNKIINIALILSAALFSFSIIQTNYFVLDFKSFFIFFIISLLGVILIFSFGMFLSYKMTIKTNRLGIFESEEIIDFYEDYIFIENSQRESKGKLLYSNFYKVKETKEYYLMYFDFRTTCIISKKEMSKEAVESLRKLLKSKIGKKLKSKY